jgi:dihydroorotase
MIDPHIHCRDGRQAYKETIKHVFEVAQEQGVKKIFDMPNTNPPILYEKDVQERLKFVPENRKKDYFLYIGATSDGKQLERGSRKVLQ